MCAIDNFTVVIPNPGIWDTSYSAFSMCNLEFTPFFKNGCFAYYKCEIKNLLLLIFREKIYLKNSIHKFTHGNNFSDFTLSEFIQSVEKINEITMVLNLNWWESNVMKLEYGCNIINIGCDAIINGLIGYKGKHYFPMLFNGRQYGAFCEMNLFKLKCYNKTMEANIHYGIKLPYVVTRWECVVKNMRYLHGRKNPIGIFKLKDLQSPQIMEALSNDLMSSFAISQKLPVTDFDGLSLTDIRIIACMKEPQIRDIIKNRHKETWKKDRKRYNEIVENSGELYQEMERKLKDKCQELIYG